MWFSAFDITYIKKECGLCGVSYGYREIHAFGFLCYRGSYVTQEKETGFLISFPRKSGMCYHIYTTRSKIKNWGGILPTTEYYIGNIFTRLVDLENHPLPKSYPITSQMKIITQKDKDGNDYITVLSEFHENNRQKVLKSDLREQQSQQQPPETELQQENMETSEQTQEVESFGNLDNSKRESFGDPNDQPMGGGYGDFGESSQQITKNTETQFGERGAKLLFFSWHDLGKSLSLRVKKNYRQYQRGRY
ncbi:MAG: hypothetical protein LBJ67_04230 [Planctomycetaceae bacterium]|nr:hypothetical protein [Planctomycetaceae bacterium]